MKEHALRFGEGGGLLGLVTVPEEQRDGSPGVLILNAGLLHRVGPCRMGVDLARRSARLGAPTLRFDSSGLGDSAPTHDDLPYEERAVRDIQSAMDVLAEQRGVDEFILLGLCSGAFNAHATALVDRRVKGAVFLDGYGYPTRRYHVRHYAARALDGERWLRFAKRKLRRSKGSGATPRKPTVYEAMFPPRERFGQELATLIANDVRMLFVYTGGGARTYLNYAEQLADAFPDLDLDHCVEVTYLPDVDHIYTLAAHRQQLYERFEQWLVPML